MDLDELQSVRDRERQTDKLQQLRESFYADAGELIQALRDQRERAAERADDPFDAPEVSRLSDEIDTAEQTVEAIYEKRVGKIVKAASFAAADLPAESDGMTAEETELFETLVADIKQNRQHVLDVLAGEIDPTADDEPPAETGESGPDKTADQATDHPSPTEEHAPDVIGEETEVSAADVMGSVPDTTADDGGPQHDSGAGTAQPDGNGRSETGTSGSDGQPNTDSLDGGGKQPVPPEQEPPAANAGTPGAASAGSGPGQAQSQQSADVGPAAGDTRTEPPESDSAGTANTTARANGEQTASPESTSAASEVSETAEVARETVRITADVGDILGVDQREYDLSTDDVVRLPADNVDPLVKRDAAERL